jgi:very-short-patch-repair endonuclease
MNSDEMKIKVWELIPKMVSALQDILSVGPSYNAMTSHLMGIHGMPKNRGNGQYMTWCLLNDNRTSILGVGALDNKDAKNINISHRNVIGKNMVVRSDLHNPDVVNYENETMLNSYRIFQDCIKQLCSILKNYIKKYPEKAYCGAFSRDMDLKFCPDSASSEFADYLVKVMLNQEILDYTGFEGPHKSKLLKVVSGKDYEIQPRIDFSKLRKGMSKGEALACLTLSEIAPNSKIIHQKKWKLCKDKKPLPFDFYDRENGLVIEIDGAQHFRSVDYFGGESSLAYTKSHDLLKNTFCSDNDIKLIRIDSSSRNVRSCLTRVYSEIENLPSVMLFGDGYDSTYITDCVPVDVAVTIDSWIDI